MRDLIRPIEVVLGGDKGRKYFALIKDRDGVFLCITLDKIDAIDLAEKLLEAANKMEVQ